MSRTCYRRVVIIYEFSSNLPIITLPSSEYTSLQEGLDKYEEWIEELVKEALKTLLPPL